MHFPLFMLFATLASSLPVQPQTTDLQQQPLHPLKQLPKPYKPNQHLDPTPKSVELLFTSDAEDDELVHLWIPLGTRIYPRDYPILPLRPTSIKINNILSGDEKRLERTTCVINPAIDPREREVLQRHQKAPLEFNNMAVSFRTGDGFVNLMEAASRWFLGGREVESYECF